MSKAGKKSLLKSSATVKMEIVEAKDATGETTTATVSEKTFDAEFHPGRHLVVSLFNGKELIHIREYQSENGKEYPTKKGACLTPGRLRELWGRISDIDAVLQQLELKSTEDAIVGDGEPVYKEHLGGGLYVSINEKFCGVDLRRYWMPPAQNIRIQPTRSGIYLPISQWRALKAKLNELLATYPELWNVEMCRELHGDNQMDHYMCRECTPFGYDCIDCL